ncbi:MAG: Dabb family protein [Planctomycetaceae bacterium]
MGDQEMKTGRMGNVATAMLVLCGLVLISGAQKAEKKPILRHVVLFKFKDGTTPEKTKQIVTAFSKLPSRIDQIIDFEWGTDVSVEKRSQGFTHGFVVSFRDAAGRDKYLPHPAHQEFVEQVGPHLENVLVFDYSPSR